MLAYTGKRILHGTALAFAFALFASVSMRVAWESSGHEPILTDHDVLATVWHALPDTAAIMAVGSLAAFGFGWIGGMFSAASRRRLTSGIAAAISLAGVAVPAFAWVFLLGGHDTSGFVTHLVGALPPAVAGGATLAIWQHREALVFLGSDAARRMLLKGLPRGRIVWRHGLRCTLPTLLGHAALGVGLVAGLVVTVEAVLGIEGLGGVLVSASMRSDVGTAMGCLVAIVFLCTGIRVGVDVLCGLVGSVHLLGSAPAGGAGMTDWTVRQEIPAPTGRAPAGSLDRLKRSGTSKTRWIRRWPTASLLGAFLLLLVVAACLAGPSLPWLSPEDEVTVVLEAGRPSLMVVCLAVVTALPVGLLLGTRAGTGNRIARSVTAGAKYTAGTVPVAAVLVFAGTNGSALSGGKAPVAVALFVVVFAWVPVAVRAGRAAEKVSATGHVLSVRAAGASRRRVLRHHILPEVRTAAIATTLLTAVGVLFTESCASAAIGPAAGWGGLWTTWGGLLHRYLGTAGRTVAEDPGFWLTLGMVTATVAGLILVASGIDRGAGASSSGVQRNETRRDTSTIEILAETLRPGETLAVLGASDAEARRLCSAIALNQGGPGVVLLSRSSRPVEVDSELAELAEPLVFAIEPGRNLGVRHMNEVIRRIRDLDEPRLVLFTDDAGTACRHADLTAVVYAGSVVETGRTGTVLGRPAMAFTAHLLASSPDLTRDRRNTIGNGRIAPPAGVPGCPYRDNCPDADDLCTTLEPPLTPVGDGHSAACWHSELIAAEARGSRHEELVP
ncbi:MAG: ABC transporter permease subunit [Actinobacteria bacterium ATB1]|nr:ABC transporter permease subunit [Actinobacteria bacterium ATB1]